MQRCLKCRDNRHGPLLISQVTREEGKVNIARYKEGLHNTAVNRLSTVRQPAFDGEYSSQRSDASRFGIETSRTGPVDIQILRSQKCDSPRLTKN